MGKKKRRKSPSLKFTPAPKEAGVPLSGSTNHKIKIWIAGLLVALATVLVYLPALGNNFVWDDFDYVCENPHIQSLGAGFSKWVFTSFHASNWHPVTWLSHALDYALWGLKPRGHHLSSILFHGLNTFLVIILVIRLLENAGIRRGTPLVGDRFRGSVLIAGAITGLLFGLHPVHVESVAWVAERKDVLYAFFFLLSLLCYLRYVSLSLHQRKFIFYGLCLFFFTMSLMSKPMAVTLPVVLVILDIYPLGRLNLKRASPSQRGVWVEKLPFLGLSFGSSIVTVVAQSAGGAVVALKYWALGVPILVSIRGLCFYLVKMVWPTGLACLYPHPLEKSLSNPEYMGALVLVVGISAFCIWQWRRQRIWGAVWAYYVVTLLPVLGIVQVGNQAAADRYTYLPSLGPFLLAGLGAAWIWNKIGRSMLRRLFVIIPSILIVTLLSNLTVKQIEVWENSMTLWNSHLERFPSRMPQSYVNRGVAYGKLGNYQREIEDYNKAIELDPQVAPIYYNRGVAYERLGKHQRAIEDYDKAIDLNPQFADAYSNRGAAYGALGNYQRAIKDFDKAIELNPQSAEAYSNRGLVYERLGNHQRAIEDYDKVIVLKPQSAEACYNRGLVHERLGNYQRAIEDFDKAIKLGGDGAELYEHLAKAYEKKQMHEEAIKAWKKVLEIDPQHREAQRSLTRLRALINK